MEKVKKIDIHAHATAFPQYAPSSLVTKLPWISAEEVIKFYDEIDVEKGVLLTLISPEYHHDIISTNDCKYLSDKYPDRFLWFCGIDPRMSGNIDSANLTHLIEHYKSLGARGVGELTAQLYTDDKMMDNLFACCEACDMPVTIHIAPQIGGYYGIVDELGLPRLEKMLKKYKKLKVLGHSQCFWSEMSADNNEQTRGGYPSGKVTDGRIVQLLRECPNLYCDCSAGSGLNALRRDVEYTAKFIEEFSDRLLYGLDICSSNNTHQYAHEQFLNEMLRNGYISERNYVKYVRTNAERILGL